MSVRCVCSQSTLLNRSSFFGTGVEVQRWCQKPSLSCAYTRELLSDVGSFFFSFFFFVFFFLCLRRARRKKNKELRAGARTSWQKLWRVDRTFLFFCVGLNLEQVLGRASKKLWRVDRTFLFFLCLFSVSSLSFFSLSVSLCLFSVSSLSLLCLFSVSSLSLLCLFAFVFRLSFLCCFRLFFFSVSSLSLLCLFSVSSLSLFRSLLVLGRAYRDLWREREVGIADCLFSVSLPLSCRCFLCLRRARFFEKKIQRTSGRC